MAAWFGPGGWGGAPPAVGGNRKSSNTNNWNNRSKTWEEYQDKDDSIWDVIVEQIEIWLDERDCKYVSNRDDNSRMAFIQNQPWTPSRFRDDQDIF